MRTTEKYTFFLATKECFSNWYKVNFNYKGINFTSSEQAMMYFKATTFNDMETAQKILETNDPAKHKELGRSVKNFNPEVWDSVATEVVYGACYAKFTQNPDILGELIATEGTELVEAAHYDKIWGIGMRETDEGVEDAKNWKGENRLGKILTSIREKVILEHSVKFGVDKFKTGAELKI